MDAFSDSMSSSVISNECLAIWYELLLDTIRDPTYSKFHWLSVTSGKLWRFFLFLRHFHSCISAGQSLRTCCSKCASHLLCMDCLASSLTFLFYGYVAHCICLGLHRSVNCSYCASGRAESYTDLWNAIPQRYIHKF